MSLDSVPTETRMQLDLAVTAYLELGATAEEVKEEVDQFAEDYEAEQ